MLRKRSRRVVPTTIHVAPKPAAEDIPDKAADEDQVIVSSDSAKAGLPHTDNSDDKVRSGCGFFRRKERKVCPDVIDETAEPPLREKVKRRGLMSILRRVLGLRRTRAHTDLLSTDAGTVDGREIPEDATKARALVCDGAALTSLTKRNTMMNRVRLTPDATEIVVSDLGKEDGDAEVKVIDLEEEDDYSIPAPAIRWATLDMVCTIPARKGRKIF